MGPTPKKLALLMSVAGLGMSLGAPAQARTQDVAPAELGSALGLPSSWHNQYATTVDADVSAIAGFKAADFAALGARLGDADPAAAAAAQRAFADANARAYAPAPGARPPVMSAEDRAAIALALVSIAEGWPADGELIFEAAAPAQSRAQASSIDTRSTSTVDARGERGSASSTPVMATSSAARGAARAAAQPAPPSAMSPDPLSAPVVTRGAAAPATVHIDLDLDLDLGVGAAADADGALDLDLGAYEGVAPATASAAGAPLELRADVEPLDLDLDFDIDHELAALHAGVARPALDLDLDVGAATIAPALDLDLDVGAAAVPAETARAAIATPVDQAGAPVAAPAKPLELGLALDLYAPAEPASATAAPAAPAAAQAVPVAVVARHEVDHVAPAGVLPSDAPISAATLGADKPVAAASPSVDKADPPVRGWRGRQPVSDERLACADEDAGGTGLNIVVASHSERVLRSLEVLLAGDDANAGRFGARPPEVFATSEAEKTLLMLAGARQKSRDRKFTTRLDADTSATADAARSAPVEVALTPGVDRASAGAAGARDPSRREADAAAEEPARAGGKTVLGDGLVALGERSLDTVRGGFQTPGGLQVSFGIERAVYINDKLVTTTSLNIADLGKVAGGGAAAGAVTSGTGNLALVQTGNGNAVINGPLSGNALGTIVQNTLDNQKIQSVTSINATVNSMQMLKSHNFVSSLRGAVIDSLRR